MQRVGELEAKVEPLGGVLGQQRARALEEIDGRWCITASDRAFPGSRELATATNSEAATNVVQPLHFSAVAERLLEVVAEHLLDLRLPNAHRRRKPVRKPLVELGPHLLRQGVVRRVADEHVAEAVCVVAGVTAFLADQLLADERLKRVGSSSVRIVSEHRLDRAAMEYRALHSCTLDHLAIVRGELIETRRQQHLNARRHRDTREISGRDPAPVLRP